MKNFKHSFLQNPFINNRLLHSAEWLIKRTAKLLGKLYLCLIKDNAPWYIPNHVLHTDLQIPTIREEIARLSATYKAKIEVHPNKLTTNLFEKHGQGTLRRCSPQDLSTRFN
jgi:hypothetical protein